MVLLKAIWRELGRSMWGPGHVTEAPPTALLDELAALLKHPSPEQRSLAMERLSERAAADDASPDLRCLLGDALLERRRFDAAEAAYRGALQIQPEHAKAQEGLGLALLRLGRAREAYLHLETAHKQVPMNADVLTHWGMVDLALGNLDAAGSKFQRAIERDPRNRHAWNNLGLVLLKCGDTARSLQHFRQAIALDPASAHPHTNLALVLRQIGELEDAHAAASRATQLAPQASRAWVILADINMDAGNLVAAEQALERVPPGDAGEPNVQIAWAKLNTARGKYDEADLAYENALRTQPEHAEARSGRGQLKLLLGDWAAGWDLFEARRDIDMSPVQRLPFPEWEGTDEPVRRLLVHSEQGLGDIILFASCLADLGRRCPHGVVEVPMRLEKLFKRSFPNLQFVSHDPAVPGTQWLSCAGRIDLQVPLGSLPRWLRRSQTDFGAGDPFLIADPQATMQWRHRLAKLPGLRIGITWRGGTALTRTRQRSVALDDLASTLAGTGASLVCLQHGEVEDELAGCEQRLGLHIDRGVSGFADLDELAALTAALDGVVTVCSTQAHLSGGLGRPALVLVPAHPSWRYGTQGPRVPWYRSITLVRQTTASDWTPALDHVRAWALALANEKGTPT